MVELIIGISLGLLDAYLYEKTKHFKLLFIRRLPFIKIIKESSNERKQFLSSEKSISLFWAISLILIIIFLTFSLMRFIFFK